MSPSLAAALPAAPAPSADALAASGPDAPAAASGAPPGLGAGPPGFASVLDDHVARTAIAEGQTKSAGGSAPESSDGDQTSTGAPQALI
ncbi:MAG: hypothetical protein JO130_00005, partial [Solirubrobacterales bacterium]|nr:hypothetical protein [Solirubrobacterales bacterium]